MKIKLNKFLIKKNNSWHRKSEYSLIIIFVTSMLYFNYLIISFDMKNLMQKKIK